jgi:GTP-binding protein
VLNKWDKVAKDAYTIEDSVSAVRRRMKYLAYAPVITVSALTGQRVSKLFAMIRQAWHARQIRVPTGTLNNIFAPDLSGMWAASHPGRKLNLRFMTQAASVPPAFVVFTSGREPLHFSLQRFLINQLRERFGFYATPIRIRQRTKPAREK